MDKILHKRYHADFCDIVVVEIDDTRQFKLIAFGKTENISPKLYDLIVESALTITEKQQAMNDLAIEIKPETSNQFEQERIIEILWNKN